MSAGSGGYHIPVLYNETLEALRIDPAGVYVDCTLGGAGHAKGILAALNEKGRLIAFDQDADALANLPADKRIIFIQENFRHLGKFLRLHGFSRVHGVLADLGVSSHQFDTGERGFSTRFDGPLDMRMDRRGDMTAAELLSTYSEQALHKMFEQYGEVTNAKTLARHITEQRKIVPLRTIDDFKTLLNPVIKGNPNKYLAQVFQAIRIEVNDEMGALKDLLQQLPACLLPGGRVAIITFHSIEDRIVKNFFRQGSFDEPDENPFSTEVKEKTFKLISKKPIEAGDEELKRNPRSRSARLRVAEKL